MFVMGVNVQLLYFCGLVSFSLNPRFYLTHEFVYKIAVSLYTSDKTVCTQLLVLAVTRILGLL